MSKTIERALSLSQSLLNRIVETEEEQSECMFCGNKTAHEDGCFVPEARLVLVKIESALGEESSLN